MDIRAIKDIERKLIKKGHKGGLVGKRLAKIGHGDKTIAGEVKELSYATGTITIERYRRAPKYAMLDIAALKAISVPDECYE